LTPGPSLAPKPHADLSYTLIYFAAVDRVMLPCLYRIPFPQVLGVHIGFPISYSFMTFSPSASRILKVHT
jgi:hypothetical protein